MTLRKLDISGNLFTITYYVYLFLFFFIQKLLLEMFNSGFSVSTQLYPAPRQGEGQTHHQDRGGEQTNSKGRHKPIIRIEEWNKLTLKVDTHGILY